MLTIVGDTYFNNNLMTTHDPHSIFNADMSGAYLEMVMMMLAYSNEGEIDILPACPKSWNKGSIEGMSLRGGIKMNKLSWDEGKVYNADIDYRPDCRFISTR